MREYQNYNDSSLPSPSEKLIIKSGHIVIIDQFMLANQQFLKLLPADSNDSDAIKNATSKFGGIYFETNSGEYEVVRDIYQKAILAAMLDENLNPVFTIDDITIKGDELFSLGHVFIDTKCLVMCDRDILFNQELLSKYSELRASGQDKQARDLIRKNGCAVRYGFSPDSDRLTVNISREKNVIALF